MPIGVYPRSHIDPEDRFWPKVERRDPDHCWEWTAGRTKGGYGTFNGNRGRGPATTAHRFAYESLVGPVPEGLTLDHLCKNTGCVNPKHLEPITLKENIGRGTKARLTHCLNGHPLSGENLRLRTRPQGGRECRQCARDRHSRKGVVRTR